MNGLSMKYLTFVGLVLGLIACKQETKQAVKTGVQHKIVVYYFCNTFRCLSCNAIESLTKAAVLGGKAENGKTKVNTDVAAPFAELIKAGTIEFKSVNIDEETNKHFLTDFNTDAKLPVIAEIKDGTVVRFKVMPNVWKLLDDDDAFIAYIQEGLKEYANSMATTK